MSDLTPAGRSLVHELAARHGVGEEAVSHLLVALVAGHGRAAQFAHPELGGGGQWMSGGMLMIGDMFDNALKARVGALCEDLSKALAAEGPGAPFLAPSASSAWWPEGLGTPSASGAQDAMRYAYFADARRLVVDTGTEVRVHDTLDHRIGGFSQQRGGAGGLSMSSQRGTVDLAALPVVSVAPEPADEGAEADAGTDAGTDAGAGTGPARTGDDDAPRGPSSAGPAAPAPSTGDDPLRLIERLGGLRDQGLLTDEEFAAKKRELLARL